MSNIPNTPQATPRTALLADPVRLALIRDARAKGKNLKAHIDLFQDVLDDVKELWSIPFDHLEALVVCAEADAELGLFGQDWDLGEVTELVWDADRAAK